MEAPFVNRDRRKGLAAHSLSSWNFFQEEKRVVTVSGVTTCD